MFCLTLSSAGVNFLLLLSFVSFVFFSVPAWTIFVLVSVSCFGLLHDFHYFSTTSPLVGRRWLSSMLSAIKLHILSSLSKTGEFLSRSDDRNVRVDQRSKSERTRLLSVRSLSVLLLSLADSAFPCNSTSALKTPDWQGWSVNFKKCTKW
jgi:hypothetical protein